MTGASEAVDRAQRRDLVDAYACGADERAGAAVAALFVDGGTLEVLAETGAVDEPVHVLDGWADIQGAIASLRRYEATLHLVGQHRVAIGGDTATGTTYCEAHHLFHREGTRYDRVLGIRYADEYRRVDGGWRFTRRRLHPVFTDFQALDADVPIPPL